MRTSEHVVALLEEIKKGKKLVVDLENGKGVQEVVVAVDSFDNHFATYLIDNPLRPEDATKLAIFILELGKCASEGHNVVTFFTGGSVKLITIASITPIYKRKYYGSNPIRLFFQIDKTNRKAIVLGIESRATLGLHIEQLLF